MTPILVQFPYPWFDRTAQALHEALYRAVPSGKEALVVAAIAGLNTGMIFADQAPYLVWKEILEAGATAGLNRVVVKTVRDRQPPTSPLRPSFDALLRDEVPVVGGQPHDGNGAPVFSKGDDQVTEQEALLFHDDLTLPVGKIPWLVGALEKLRALAPSVCRFNVVEVEARQLGSGFRIATDLLLTNWHVFYLYGAPLEITAEFGYEDDGKGGGLPSTAVACDIGSIHASEQDDWAVIRTTSPMPAGTPIIKLSDFATPVLNASAFIVQHPNGDRKRLAYARNQITSADDRVVHYLSDTQHGSSGSPVLDDAGHLIALHHAGGRPQEVAGKMPIQKNEGIAIPRVLDGLAKANVTVP